LVSAPGGPAVDHKADVTSVPCGTAVRGRQLDGPDSPESAHKPAAAHRQPVGSSGAPRGRQTGLRPPAHRRRSPRP